jgi:peptidyl-prolyl cis-trans isomerase B (cyclophilin B)
MKLTILSALALFLMSSLALAQTQPAPKAPDATEPPKFEYVEMKTSAGTIILELNREKAPITVENFLRYVAKRHYDGTIFHRVIQDFVIQGGGLDVNKREKPTDPPIINEHKNGLKNKRGTISMARKPDPNSATSQFFINVEDNDGTKKYDLDRPPGYAVFGRVIHGMDVVDAIRNAPVGRNDMPEKPVVIERVTRITEEDVRKYLEKEKAEKAEKADKPAEPDKK